MYAADTKTHIKALYKHGHQNTLETRSAETTAKPTRERKTARAKKTRAKPHTKKPQTHELINSTHEEKSQKKLHKVTFRGKLESSYNYSHIIALAPIFAG